MDSKSQIQAPRIPNKPLPLLSSAPPPSFLLLLSSSSFPLPSLLFPSSLLQPPSLFPPSSLLLPSSYLLTPSSSSLPLTILPILYFPIGKQQQRTSQCDSGVQPQVQSDSKELQAIRRKC